MKMYCLIPYGYGDDSYFVMANTEEDALSAIFEFKRKENEWPPTREKFNEYVKNTYEPIKSFGLGEVVANANA